LEQQISDKQEECKRQMDGWKEEFALDLVNKKYFYKGWLVIPDDDELKWEILRQFHDCYVSPPL
jgi:hypothetical protein